MKFTTNISIAGAFVAGIGLAIGLAPVTSFAAPASATYVVDLGAGPGFTHPGPTYYAPGSYRAGAETGSISVFPSPSLVVHAGGALNETHIALAQAAYYFAISGPAGVIVPILLTGSMSASSSTLGAHALSSATIIFSALTQVRQDVGGFDSTQTWSGTLRVDAFSDQGGAILLYVSADTQGGGLADASIDPVIQIDPSFAGASRFTLTLSPGVGNGPSPVPEPISLTLFGTGVLALGIARRRAS